MALPKIEYPVHTVQLLSIKDPVRFRPFIVKEQKLLMMALESDDLETIIDAVKQIINNCSIDNINVDKLPLVDIEYFFLQLRARSVSENVDLFFKCKNVVEEKECGMIVDATVDVTKEVNIINSAGSNKIMFNNKVGVLMRYPTLDQVKLIDDENLTAKEKLIIDCVDKIFDEENVIDTNETTREELIQFIDSLSSTDYEKLETFVEASPTIQYIGYHDCPKCKFSHKIVLEGLNDFFL